MKPTIMIWEKLKLFSKINLNIKSRFKKIKSEFSKKIVF